MAMNREQIEQWLKKYGIQNYTIHDNLVVDVNGDVNLYNQKLKELPFQFGKVTGLFDCSNNQLTSLRYCPTTVGGSFYCSENQLTSLQYCPTTVWGSFDCSNNQLTSLQYCPTAVGGNFYYDDVLTLADFGKIKIEVTTSSPTDILEPFRNEYVKQFMAGNMNNKTFVEYIKDLLKV